MSHHASGLWSALLLAVLVNSSVQAASYDPLDVPALKSSRASTSTLIAVARSAPDNWVAVGRRGHILVAQDGLSWQQSMVPVSTDLVSVFFLDAKLGWAVGHGGVILNSTDGGKSWSKQMDGRKAAELLVRHYKDNKSASAEAEVTQADLADAQRFQHDGPGRPFLDIWFGDSQRGYAIGAYNLLFATVDGGKTWTPQPEQIDNEKKLHLNAIKAIGGDVFVAGEQGFLARLNRRSKRFEAVATPYVGSYFGLVGRDGLLVLFGLQGNAYRSRDQGVSWEKLNTGVQSTITCGTLTDDGRLVLGTQSGLLLVSTDSGDQFVSVRTAQGAPINGIAPGIANALVLVGAGGVRSEILK